ncbi:MAG: hypothetical protein ACLTDR_11200 [Adlercreutzia equolifaciens]
MAELNVREQFLGRFSEPLSGAARRRIVIWHDADGEFEGDFDALAAEAGKLPAAERPLRFLKAEDGALFAAKRTLAREDTGKPTPRCTVSAGGDIAGDLLADIELFAEHFRADGLSLSVAGGGRCRLPPRCARPWPICDRSSRPRIAWPPRVGDAPCDRRRRCARWRAGGGLGESAAFGSGHREGICPGGLGRRGGGRGRPHLGRLERYGADGALRRYVEAVTGYAGTWSCVRSWSICCSRPLRPRFQRTSWRDSRVATRRPIPNSAWGSFAIGPKATMTSVRCS